MAMSSAVPTSRHPQVQPRHTLRTRRPLLLLPMPAERSPHPATSTCAIRCHAVPEPGSAPVPTSQAGALAAEDGSAGGRGSAGTGGSSSGAAGRSSFELTALRVRLFFAFLAMATVYYYVAFPLRWIWTDGLLAPTDLDWQRLVQAKLVPQLLWLRAVMRLPPMPQHAIAAAAACHASDIPFGQTLLLIIFSLCFSYAVFLHAVVAWRAYPKRTPPMNMRPFLLTAAFFFLPGYLFLAALPFLLFA